MHRALTANVVAELSETRCPVLYIRGVRDRLIPSACWKLVHRIRPDAILTELDAPHLVLQAAPTLAWRVISDFLAPAGQTQVVGQTGGSFK